MRARLGGARLLLRRLEPIDPFRFSVTAVSILIGVNSMLFGSSASTAMTRVLGGNENIVRFWGALLFLSGIAATYGPLWRRLQWERTGLWPLGFFLLVYGVTVLVGLGKGGLIAGPLSVACGLACFWRARRSLQEEAETIARRRHIERDEAEAG